MDLWKLAEAKKLIKTEEPLPEPEAGLLRVRVTKVFLNGQDAAIYSGGVKVKYPLIPWRYAVGFVAEEGDPVFPKNTRVLLHGYRPVPKTGTEKRDFGADDFYALGRTADGFMRDFVNVSPDDMTALPASVSDERALLLHQVAAAKEVTDRLQVQKGQHIAVVGADLIGILICQLLIYQQAAPILIDADPARLEFAGKCGIYYTVKSGANVVDRVAELTGGRLTRGAAYVASASGNDTDLPFLVTARETGVVFFGTSANKVIVSLGVAMRKHISVHTVSHGIKYLKTAINLMANHAVDPTPFHANAIKPDRVEALLADYSARPDRDVDEINCLELL